MAEESYKIVEALIPINPDKGKIIFADKSKIEIFRGQAKYWREFDSKEFIEFLKKNGFLLETTIAIAQDGPSTFAVIQIINL